MSHQRLEPPRATREEQPPTLSVPDRISSSDAKLVYLYLEVRGSVTVDELAASLDMPKLALFSILQTLDETDLIVRDGDAVSLT